MTSSDRIMAAFAQRQADKVPVHHLGFSADVASALLGREAYVGGGIQQWREATALWEGAEAHQAYLERSFRDALDIARFCEHDIVRASYWRYNVRPTQRIDANTFLYEYGPEDDWRVLRYDPGSEQCHIFPYRTQARLTSEDLARQVAQEESDLADYVPQEEDFAFEIRAQRLVGQERVVRVGGVNVGIPLQDIEAWLEAMAMRPGLVARYLDLQVERAARNVAFLVQFGFRYFFGGLDFAANEGPMYSPRAFRELVLPRLQRVSTVCHQHGAYHLFASDGNLWPVADELFGQSGIDGYYEIDRRAGMDLRALRDRFPHLVLMGNIGSHTLHLGSEQDVVEETLSCLEEARRSGSIIVGVSNYLVPHTPPGNVMVMLRVISENR